MQQQENWKATISPISEDNKDVTAYIELPMAAREPAGYPPDLLEDYGLGRIELLQDRYVWAYERSVQEYIAITQELAEPDPLRLSWRKMIKQTVLTVITNPQLKPLDIIDEHVSERAVLLAITIILHYSVADSKAITHQHG